MFFLIFIALIVTAAVAAPFVFQPVRSALQRSVFRQKENVAHELEQMFIFISVDRLQQLKWTIALALAISGLILAWDATPPAPWLVAAVLGAGGYWAPEIFIVFLRRRRRAAFSEQLVDGLVLMANGLRAGFNLQQAVDMMIEEMPAPLSQEFDLVRREWKVGVNVDQALRNCVTRTQDEDLDLVVTAVQITRQLGGNLADVFDRIVAMVRERKILKGKADALTSEGRLQAVVVGLLPYVFMFFMVKINPQLMRLMWTTIPGFCLLILVIILDLVGYFWVRKVSNVEF